jgi:pimeloyl-ACP methyl ester carboxylesterase
MRPADWIASWVALGATAACRRAFPSASGVREVSITTEDRLRLSGWQLEVEAPRGTIVLAHGYRDDRRQLWPIATPLAAIGYRILAFDFRAHGRSEGSRITIGHEEERDVRAILAHARGLGGPVGYLGFSMGAAAYLIAVARGAREAEVAVLDAPYDTLAETIAVRARFLRLGALETAFVRAKERRCEHVVAEVRPIDAAPLLRSPTTFVFARGDRWIPAATRARYRAAMSSACSLAEVEGGHDGHFGAEWRERVIRAFALL